jgi:competence protein ComGC
MNFEIIFPVSAIVLAIVEVMLIISVRNLTKSIKKLNTETQTKFQLVVDEINSKFKTIINTAVGIMEKKKK